MTDLKTYGTLILFGLTMFVCPSFADLRDPTRPPEFLMDKSDTASSSGKETGGAVAISGLVLTSTMISPSRRAAVINGEVVNKGDKVGNMTVVDIKPFKVLLKGASERLILTLIRDEDLIRKPVNDKAQVK